MDPPVILKYAITPNLYKYCKTVTRCFVKPSEKVVYLKTLLKFKLFIIKFIYEVVLEI